MTDLTTWFSGLSIMEQIYWTIAIPATLAFLIQMILAFFGGDTVDDTPDADLDVESDTGLDFQFLTLRNMIAFFTIFSWTGIACLDSDMSNTTSFIVSLIAGLVMMLIMATLMYYLSKLRQSGTLILSSAINHTGSAYLRIPGKRAGMGKVQITIQGSLHELDAVTDEEETIASGAIVKVAEVLEGNILLVVSHK